MTAQKHWAPVVGTTNDGSTLHRERKRVGNHGPSRNMAGRTQLDRISLGDSREEHFRSTRQSCEDRELGQPRRKVLDGLSYGKKEKWKDVDTPEEKQRQADEKREKSQKAVIQSNHGRKLSRKMCSKTCCHELHGNTNNSRH